LGIPGSATAAIIGSTLYVHGLIPGPELFTKSPHVAYTFLYGMLLPVIAMMLIGSFAVKYFSYILKIKMYYMLPIVIICAMFGVYCLNGSLFEVRAAVVLGILGAAFKFLDVPAAPVVVGIIISPLMELNLRRSLVIAKAAKESIFLYIVQRPLCIVLVVFVGLLLFLFFRMKTPSKNLSDE
jgi:putative tricarboxylic transport membrane protein